MPNQSVRFTVSLAIPEDNFAKFEAIVETMIAGTQREPGALAYDWCLSPDRKRCRLIEHYASPDAVLAHLNSPVVQELVPKLLQVATLTGFEVYGDPGPKAAEVLARVGAEIFPTWRTISR